MGRGDTDRRRRRPAARGRRRSARSPPGSASARPSSGARTSSSTPTPCAAIVRVAGVGRTTSSSRSAPGSGSLTLALLPGRRARGRRRGRPACSPRALPATVAGARPRRCRPARRSCTPTRSRVRDLPGPPPTALVANLPYNVVGAGACCTSSRRFPPLAARAGHGADRGRRPARRRARLARSTASQRQGSPGTPTCAWRGTVVAQRVLAGAQRRLRPGVADPPRAAGDHGAPARRSSRASTRRSPSAARPCAPRSPAGPAPPSRAEEALRRRRRRPPHPRGAARRGSLRRHRRRALDDPRRA